MSESNQKYEIMLDAPKQAVQAGNTLTVRGWLISFHNEVLGLRINKNNQTHEIEYGLPREDVLKVRPQYETSRALLSGFETEYDFEEDGMYDIEADFGDGFEKVLNFELIIKEPLYKHYFNPDVAENIAEHKTVIDAKKKYYHREASDQSYELNDKDPRLVAFYLPQYHPLAQNDETWGKGFTEWTNVTQGTPRFVGHEQPILPSDLGFYDLRNEFVIKNQIDLAKKYGIRAFCFYYYWFSGEKILDTPINSFLEHTEWDFNFMICWANENWTKRWDGQDNEVIISQKYRNDDPIKFIQDVEHILLDTRYLREDGKPLLAVYRGSELKKPKEYIRIWRDYFREKHNIELHIVSMMNFDSSDPRKQGFDAGVEFAPLSIYKNPQFDKERATVKNFRNSFIDTNYLGNAIDYRALLSTANGYSEFDFPTYKSVSPSWDNDARKKGKQSGVFYAANADNYGKWLKETIDRSSHETNSPLIFINAWNEWGEGAVLEPTLGYGHANLLRTAEVIAEYSSSPINKKNFPMHGLKTSQKTSDTVVLVHVFYEKEWINISKKIQAANFSHDLFITLPSRANHLSTLILKEHPKAIIIDVPNRGRDVLPFVIMANKLKDLGYEYLLKLHTKRTVHRNDGSEWLDSIVSSLIGEGKTVKTIVDELKTGTAIIGPAGHYVSLWENSVSTKKTILEYLNKQNSAINTIDEYQKYGFFAGTMFWCRMDALNEMVSWMLCPEDFESERGQRDGTLAHALERMITVIPQLESKRIAETDGKMIKILSKNDGERAYEFNQSSNRTADITNAPIYKSVLDYKKEIIRLENSIKNKDNQLNQVIRTYTGTVNSKSYRAGRLLLSTPRAARIFYRKSRNILGLAKNDHTQKKKINDIYNIQIRNERTMVQVNLYIRSYYHPTSSTFIRLVSPFSDKNLQDITTIALRDGEKPRFYKKSNVIIVQRTAITHLEDAIKLVKHVRENDIKLFVDTDDAFGELDVTHPQYELQKERVDALNYVIENADEVWFSTKQLQNLYSLPLSKVVRNTLDPKVWPKLLSKEVTPPSETSPLRAVYMGTVTHSQDFEMIVPALEKLHKALPGQFKLYVIGVSAKLAEKPWVEVLKPNSALYPEFTKWFSELPQFDIGLSPLVDNSFNKSKSDIKCLDYLANGIKPIVSDVTAYKNKELDELIVRVSNTIEDWYAALEKEVNQRVQSRKEMQKHAKKGFDYIVKERSPATAAKQIRDSIEKSNKNSSKKD